MRKAVLTVFLVFYTATVVSLTVDRTEAWAAEHANSAKHSPPEHGVRIGEAHKHTPHQVQTKLHEDGSVLICTEIRSSDPLYSEAVLHHRLAGFVAHLNGRAISPRAPPSLL